MGRFLLACILLTALTGTVSACMNDTELPQYEREFRSQYQMPPSQSSTPAPQPIARAIGLFIGGAALLCGAVGMTVLGTRARN